ncbi:MAG: four helix bundle protein [Ignavibacteria bacterium]|nr:four helix bundle protein [Ignavibacteria bacterium]
MKEGNVIKEKSFDFALRIISLYQVLKENNEYVLSRQLLRSGTSIGANVEEASAASSKKDFINKMAIASKEARETIYWLKLLQRSKLVKYDFTSIMKDIDEIIRILTAIVKSSSDNSKLRIKN